MRRALLSVSDKTGLVEFARGVAQAGFELLASGGTAGALRAAGIAHLSIEEVTGQAELLSGRVKTLHTHVHAAILADRNEPSHMDELVRSAIEPIDLVVCNLYPFDSAPDTELIDIGGVALLRAAAKNHLHVAAVCDPADYGSLLEEIRGSGWLSEGTRRALAAKVFRTTSCYDRAIAKWLEPEEGETELPERVVLDLSRSFPLRYGENPHQRGALYVDNSAGEGWWGSVVKHQGETLSYLNVVDAEAAWQLAWELSGGNLPAAVVVKHGSPCGAAVSDSAASAYEKALATDPVSAFGGIVAVSAVIDDEAAAAIAAGPQMDVVVAPSYDGSAIEVLRRRRSRTRILEGSRPRRPQREIRAVDGGMLLQGADLDVYGRQGWTLQTGDEPTELQRRDLELAWVVCARALSNAVVIASEGSVLGIGAGQPNRKDAAEMAVARAGEGTRWAVAASDGFFPMRDGLDTLARAGVAAVVHPGGSVRDGEVVAAAAEHGITLLSTGRRHFRH